MKKKKSKMGRPPVPVEKRRSFNLNVRLTENERDALESAARKAGLTVGEYVRRRLREEA
jgi:predicted HicB family RNase H-like nuclease